MNCKLVGLRVTCAAHNGESGEVVHAYNSTIHNVTRCVVLFDDGHLDEFNVTDLKGEASTGP